MKPVVISRPRPIYTREGTIGKGVDLESKEKIMIYAAVGNRTQAL
jgi:hypothetical protein